MSLWALASSPLILGANETHLDNATLALLANDEVIVVEKDPLGRSAHRISTRRALPEMLAKELASGALAAGFSTGPARYFTWMSHGAS
jgi:alpha-galactosidase